jgi:sugar phosphate isomerase/epimerase
MYTIFDKGHNGVDGSIEEMVPLLVKHGIGGMQVDRAVVEDAKFAREMGKLLRDNGLKWGLLPTPVDFYAEDVDDERFDAAIETLKRWAACGERAGVRYSYNHVWNGSNARDYAENFEWNAYRIRRVWNVMNDHGIRYGLEFLGPHPLRNSFKHPFFNSIGGVLSLADTVDARCGFLFDTYHWYCGGANVGDLYFAAKHVERMIGFHVNDGVAGRAREEQQDLERNMPLTTGVIDAALPWRLFDEHGYTGMIMCEPMRPWSANAQGQSLEERIADNARAFERVRRAARDKR